MESKPHTRQFILKGLLWLGLIVAVIALVLGTYVFASSPASIRTPELEHYHFRMQVVVDGQDVDFSDDRFQIAYSPNQCTGELTTEPIHFHDKQDQFVHVHWAGMTGGLVLKNYGWNYIGGADSILGYRLDTILNPQAVPIHGNELPKIDDSYSFYVYIGDESGYTQKDFTDFVNQDLETFFGVASTFPVQEGGNSDETIAESLVRINNLLGNVVLFAQKEEPTDEEIMDRLNNLVPLTDSTCGG